MSISTNKTAPSQKDVSAFIDSIGDEKKRSDCHTLNTLMKSTTGQQPEMWGDSMVGFGRYHYTYASGRQGEYFRVGFSPRKATITVYLLNGTDKHKAALQKLGPHKTAISCLYIKRLTDVDMEVLGSIIHQSYTDRAMGG